MQRTDIHAVAERNPGGEILSARSALAALALTVLLSSMNTSIVNVALPTFTTVFAVPLAQAQWTVLAYLLAITALIVGAGRLGDLFGRRRVLLAGLGVFIAGAALAGMVSSLGWLLAARFLQGIGAAVMMALAIAAAGDTAVGGNSGRVMGLLGTMSALGTALGPALGGILISSFGWRAIFLINVPLGGAAWFLLRRHLPRDRATESEETAGFDWKGTLLLAIALTAYALALTFGGGRLGPVNLILAVAAIAGLGLFVLVERGAATPLIRWETLRDPQLRARLAMSVLVAGVLMATLIVGPFYLAGALGMSAGAVGLVLSVGPIVAALTAVPAGRLVDRVGADIITAGGLGGIALGCGALVFLPTSLDVVGYLVPTIVMTAGYSLFQTANNTAVMAHAGQGQRGVVSGLLNLSRNLGLITGAAALGAVFARASIGPDGVRAGVDAVAGGMKVTFAVAAVPVLVALVVAWRQVGLAGQELILPADQVRRLTPHGTPRDEGAS